MKKILLSLFGIGLLFGCAANDGVVRTEKGTFIVSAGSSGISDLSDMKAESTEEASSFCENRGQVLQVVRLRGTEPPYYLTHLPEVEIEFMCSDRQGSDTIASSR
ncbi:hypothetical protein BAC1_01567 [uncultured bacterium]|nr:hypothetical protein BAC1_01567 [uncultured bacterium]